MTAWNHSSENTKEILNIYRYEKEHFNKERKTKTSQKKQN
jgi:hypothetical protein